ncbi:MAG TPA: hypothetical protein VNR20_02855 [Terriglobales bacterium]|nr:hypothetical protein [Terriglobales bacterium]
MNTTILGFQFDALQALVVLGILILFTLWKIAAAVERSEATSLKTVEKTLFDIQSELETIRSDTSELTSIRMDVRQLRHHIAGASSGEMAKALAEWDEPPSSKEES